MDEPNKSQWRQLHAKDSFAFHCHSEVSCFLFCCSANFSDHYDRMGMGIRMEKFKAIYKTGPINGIPTNTDTGGLPQSHGGCLGDSFISQCPRARHNPHMPWLMDVAWHNADFTLIGGYNPRTIRSNKTGGRGGQIIFHSHHIEYRNTFSDADNQLNTCVSGFQDGISSKRRRNLRSCRVQLSPFSDH